MSHPTRIRLRKSYCNNQLNELIYCKVQWIATYVGPYFLFECMKMRPATQPFTDSFLKFTFMKNEFKHIFTRNFQVRAHFATKTKCNQYGLLVQTVYLDMNQKQLHGGKDTAPWAESTSYQKISWYIKIWQGACMCLEDLLALKGWRIPQSHLSSEWESTSVDSYPYNN